MSGSDKEQNKFLFEILDEHKQSWGAKPKSYEEVLRNLKSRSNKNNLPFTKGRDAKPLDWVMEQFIREQNWGKELSQNRLILEWANIVGETVALHTTILGIQNGILHIKCDTTAWQAQIRRVKSEYLCIIQEKYPEAKIYDFKFVPVSNVTFPRGVWRVQGGRGLRDTYG
ncbi:DUF721 domain-containing protein [Canibacter sp. lx-72]|uniref:DUF721 domain-containing protein n=1 Tax=Canibacter zhuwentaonis TaxID=2837491 RepID=UPI001BDD02C9|nr:DUF721 domain-containing protein [Canibacter zhuwentaonis]